MVNRFIVISTYGYWTDFANYEQKIIDYLASKNIIFDWIICDGIISYCDHHATSERFELKRKKSATCMACISGYKLENLSEKTKPTLLSDIIKRYCRDQHSNLSEQHNELGINGHYVTLSNIFKLSASYIRNSHFYLKKQRSIFNSSKLIACALKYHLKKKEGFSGKNIFIMTHSHRTILNVVEQMLAKDTSNYIFSYAGDHQKEGSFIFHDNKCQLHRPLTLETPEPITNIQIEEHIKNEALSYYKDKILLRHHFFEANVSSLTSNISIHASNKDLTKLRFTSLNHYAHIISIFLSTESENISSYHLENDSLQAYLVNNIASLAERCPDCMFIIREHPNKYISKINNIVEKSFCYDELSLASTIAQHDNVIFIPAIDPFSSESLIDISDCIICPESSIIEYAVLSCKPVIASSYSLYAPVANTLLNPKYDTEHIIYFFDNIHTYISEFQSSESDFLSKIAKLYILNVLAPESISFKSTRKGLEELVNHITYYSNGTPFESFVNYCLANRPVFNKEQYLQENFVNKFDFSLYKKGCKVISLTTRESFLSSEYENKYKFSSPESISSLNKYISFNYMNACTIYIPYILLLYSQRLKLPIISDIRICDKDCLIHKEWVPSNNLDELKSNNKKFIPSIQIVIELICDTINKSASNEAISFEPIPYIIIQLH